MHIHKIVNTLLILLIYAILAIKANDPKHCFDILDKLSKKQVQNIYLMNFIDTAYTHPATDILSCYLKESHPGDTSITSQYFEIYKLCGDFKNRINFEPFGYHQLDELVALGLPYNLEVFLHKIIETHDKNEIKKGLIYVQDVMGKEVELSKDYKEYKHIILMKYKPSCVISSDDFLGGFKLFGKSYKSSYEKLRDFVKYDLK